jgi:hypothetical protein
VLELEVEEGSVESPLWDTLEGDPYNTSRTLPLGGKSTGADTTRACRWRRGLSVASCVGRRLQNVHRHPLTETVSAKTLSQCWCDDASVGIVMSEGAPHDST